MNRLIKIIISIILLIIVIGGIYMLFFKKEKIKENVKIYNEIINSKYEHGPLTGIRYMDSSAYGGYSHSLDIELTDGKYILKQIDVNYDEGNESNVVEYSVSNEDFKEIEDYVKKYNLPDFSKFKESEYQELDGNTVTISMYYNNEDNYEAYSVSYDLDIPSEGYKVLNKLVDKIKTLTKSVNKIKEYKEND